MTDTPLRPISQAIQGDRDRVFAFEEMAGLNLADLGVPVNGYVIHVLKTNGDRFLIRQPTIITCRLRAREFAVLEKLLVEARQTYRVTRYPRPSLQGPGRVVGP